MIESFLILAMALGMDLALGDPRNRFHPTSWIGGIISRIVPYCMRGTPVVEKTLGALLVILVCGMAVCLLVALYILLDAILETPLAVMVIHILVLSVLLKMTIAMRGMERHAMMVVGAIEQGNLGAARDMLALIVKRDTKPLDREHVMSGVLESVSENTVDGVTGPLFYFGLFGIFGAVVYRIVNTFDSMIGYTTETFKNLGWFAAGCDRTLNYLPSRITGIAMIASSFILGMDWRGSYRIMMRDHTKTSSPNAGYPMAALAGALNIKLEKINHYTIGDGDVRLSASHVRSSILLMKTASILFCCMFTVPALAVLYYARWLIHA